MSPDHPEGGPSLNIEAETAGLARALQHNLQRRAAFGRRRVARLAGPSAPPAPPTTGASAPGGPPAPQNETHAATQSAPGRAPAPSRPAAERPPQAAPTRSPSPVPPSAAPLATRPDGDLKGLSDQASGAASLDELRACVASCTACELASTRTQTVFGDGSGERRILFVGEAPGEDEDAQGVPFVGRAGALLDDIITKGMGIAREDVYIANVIKCRPPENRDPRPEEKALCSAWLDRQIELLDPLVIIPLGRHAAGYVLGVDAPLGRLRGKVHDHNGRKVVPTYHPAYLLRSPQEKRKTWADIQLAMGVAGLSGPGA